MTALSRPIEHSAAPTSATHLRLATAAAAELVEQSPAEPVLLQDHTEVFAVDSFRRGCGTEAIETTTTTTIASDPAPVAPAEQSFMEIDTAVREVLEGRFALDTGRHTLPDVVDCTMAAVHVPVLPLPENTQITTPPAKSEAAPEGTVVVDRPVLLTPVNDGTMISVHVPASAPAPIAVVADAVPVAIDEPRKSSPSAVTTSIIVRERKSVPPIMQTSARLAVPGHYLLEDSCDVSIDVTVGASLLLGRESGSVLADDPYVDAQHTELTFRPDGVVVDDLDSTNGVFLRVRGKATLRSGDEFRVGEQLLSFTALKRAPKNGKAPALGSPDPGYWGRVDVLLGPTTIAASYPVDDVEVGFGQNDGHVQFPDDPFVADLHCRLVKEEKGASIEDCGSTHGTWVRLRSGDVVPYGADLMVGYTLLRVEWA